MGNKKLGIKVSRKFIDTFILFEILKPFAMLVVNINR